MELIFVRHAQPQWVTDGLSNDDPVLTESGWEQAELLGRHFEGRTVDRLFVSPLVRAQQTAQPIIEALGVEPVTHDWMAEITAPTWQGTPSELVERAFADNRRQPLEKQWEGLPGGESFRAFHERVTTGLGYLLAEMGCERLVGVPPLWQVTTPGPRVVFVAHAGTNAVALGHLLGIDPVPWEWERFVAFHASISVIQPMTIADAHSFSLFRFSDTSHLPERLHTY